MAGFVAHCRCTLAWQGKAGKAWHDLAGDLFCVNDPSVGPQTGGDPIASRDLEAGCRGPDGQFRPELASGGLSWPRGRLQTTIKVDWKLGASLTASGDHSEPISDNFPRFWALSII